MTIHRPWKFNNFRQKYDQPARLTKLCEWPKCDLKANFKAPRSNIDLRDFRWFCLKHVKIYNSSWNYFDGFNEKEIEQELMADATWHRPSWKFGSAEGRVHEKYFSDVHNILDDEDEKDHTKYSKKIIKNNYSALERALDIFELEFNSSLKIVKARYKTLVKKYHPDKNNGDQKALNKLVEINAAYDILMTSLKIK